MSTLALLLLCTFGWFLLLWNSQAQTPQPVYPEPVVPNFINKPEAVTPRRRIPVDFWAWKQDLPVRVEYQGHLFAGKAEFPYVVWIKAPQQIYCEDEDQIFNKVLRRFAGAIVAWNLIMTACHKLVYAECKQPNRSTWPVWPDKVYTLNNPVDQPTIPLWPGIQINEELIMCPERNVKINLCDSHLFEIHYATVYLYEENKHTDLFQEYSRDTTGQFAGRRTAIQTLVHPQCEPHKSLENDVGIIVLDRPIFPAGTWVSTVPFPITARHSYDDIDLDDEYIQTHICYIAAFNELYAGMPYNDGRQITRDYKVKFRIYQTDIMNCMNFAKIICFDSQLVFVRGCWNFLKLKFETMRTAERKSIGIECWETRHKVGAVCDIHSGAPLVCNGLVYGHVIRAADDERCNINIPVPFFIQRNHNPDIYGYLAMTEAMHPKPQPDFDYDYEFDRMSQPHAYKGRYNTSRSSRHSQNLLFMLACVFPYSVVTYIHVLIPEEIAFFMSLFMYVCFTYFVSNN